MGYPMPILPCRNTKKRRDQPNQKLLSLNVFCRVNAPKVTVMKAKKQHKIRVFSADFVLFYARAPMVGISILPGRTSERDKSIL
jgi:hypothetical protein